MLMAREQHWAKTVAKTCRWQEHVHSLGEEWGVNSWGYLFFSPDCRDAVTHGDCCSSKGHLFAIIQWVGEIDWWFGTAKIYKAPIVLASSLWLREAPSLTAPSPRGAELHSPIWEVYTLLKGLSFHCPVVLPFSEAHLFLQSQAPLKQHGLR